MVQVITKTKDDQATRNRDRILVMEEETSLCKLIRRQLANFDIGVIVTNNVESCICEYERSISDGLTFTCAIIDLNIAGKKVAVKTLEKLKQIDPDIKAVVTSGSIHDETMANYEQHGFQGALAKPFGKEELFSVVHKILKKV